MSGTPTTVNTIFRVLMAEVKGYVAVFSFYDEVHYFFPLMVMYQLKQFYRHRLHTVEAHVRS